MPFPLRPDPTAFLASPAREESLARLDFLVEYHRRLGLLLGPSGVGKTLLLGVFAARLRRRGCAVVAVGLVGAEPIDLVWQLAAGLGAAADPSDDLAMMWHVLTEQLTANRYEQRDTVLLLDDADAASPETLLTIHRLARHDATADARLTLVLAGRPERIGRIGPALLDRADLRVDVDRWEAEDTRRFITESLARAGRRKPVFADEALARLQELSDGLPRRASRLAELAMVAGAGRGLDQVDADVVQSAYEELGVVQV
ncbi:MAG: AAA family ATPase [Pirellulales bacterium]|nr:AAA family ATPase [Pirellulales bacterium]